MKKNYQTTTRRAGTSGRTTPKKATADLHRTKYETAVTLPEAVTVAVGELASELEEGLLAFAVGAGLKVLDVILEEEAIQMAGPRGIHDPDREAVRHGTEDGLVALGGRQVSIRRPRLRTGDRAAEVALPTYAACTSTELLGRETLTRMMAKSAVSRRFVAATQTALAELMAADLSNLDLVAFMVDGVHCAGHCGVVALGIDIEGNKHPLALEEGATENATLVKDLIAGLRERGLDVTRPILAVLDGSKALASAVSAVFDHPVIARCQLHEIRNVESKLPDDVAKVVGREMRAAYANPDALVAEGALRALAKRIERSHPGAAASLREGLAETLTVARLGVPPTLVRTLRSTNAVESMIEVCRDHSRNVKRWRDGAMVLRWCAAGMIEAKKQFRRVNGHLHLRSLRTALNQHVAEAVTPSNYCPEKEVAA